MRRAWTSVSAVVCLLAIACAVPAQSAYPERTVTLVVPFAAGGITDVLARTTAERLRAKLGQPFIVETVAGAAGATAAIRVAKAEPDGYTLFFATLSQIGIGPVINPNLGYDPVKDFKPISIIATSPFVISVGVAMPVDNLAGFIARVKAQPGQIAFGSAGIGTLTHLSAALFLKNAGLQMNHVPYRGVGPAFQDLLAGHIAMVSASPVEVKPFEEKGGIRLLAVSSDKRSAMLPNVPAIEETLKGVPPVFTWNGMLAPAATPPTVVDVLSREIMAAERDPEFLSRLAALGVDPIVHTPDDFAKVIASGLEHWRGIIPDLGLKPQ